MPKKEKKAKKKLTKLEKWFRTLHRAYAVLGFIYPCKMHGNTQKLNDGAYIIVGNHKHILDVLPSGLKTDRPVHFMAKKELFEKGFCKWITNKCECIPVSRDGSDVRAVMTAMKYLKNGEIVNIFPEGTRNKTDELFLPFRSGAAAISLKTHTPIVLMVQVKKMKMFHTSHILYSDPFEFTEYYDKKLTPEIVEECDGILRKKMEEMYYELQEMLDKKKKKKK